jgi:hypothetical protein
MATDATTNDAGLADRAMDVAIRSGQNGTVGIIAEALNALRNVNKFGPGTAGERARERVAALLTETDPAVLRELLRAANRASARQRVSNQGRVRRAVRSGKEGGRLVGMALGSPTEQPVE